MRIRRISFVGIRTDSFAAMTAIARDVLGLASGHRDDGWAVFQLESGDRDPFEVYGPGQYYGRLFARAPGGRIYSSSRIAGRRLQATEAPLD